MPATGWRNHDAAVRVARAEHIPAATRHEILDMLGLLTPAGRAVRPDPGTEEQKVAHASGATLASIHGDVTDPIIPANGRMTRRFDGPPLGGKLCPPGLRALFEGQPPVRDTKPVPPPEPEPPAKPEPKPRPRRTRKVVKPGVGRGNGREPQPIRHGHPNGARLHRKRGETPCEECLEGRRAYDRENKQRTYKPKPPRDIAECGTPAGRERHRRLKEKVCDACKAARTEARRTSRAA